MMTLFTFIDHWKNYMKKLAVAVHKKDCFSGVAKSIIGRGAHIHIRELTQLRRRRPDDS